MEQTEFELTFIKRDKEGDNVYSWAFEKPEGLTWTSGQQITLKLTHELEDERNFRTLSIASSPDEEKLLFLLKIPEPHSKYKEALMNLAKGDKVILAMPRGLFMFKNETKNHVCIAGGVGIAPFRPMFYDVVHGTKEIDMTELVYLAHPDNIGYKEDFDTFAKHDAVTVHYSPNRTDGTTLTEELVEKYGEDAYYYIAGTPAMVDTFKTMLLDKQIPQEQIVLDIFTGY